MDCKCGGRGGKKDSPNRARLRTVPDSPSSTSQPRLAILRHPNPGLRSTRSFIHLYRAKLCPTLLLCTGLALDSSRSPSSPSATFVPPPNLEACLASEARARHGAASKSRQECRQDELFPQRAYAYLALVPRRIHPLTGFKISPRAVALLLFAHGDVKNPLPETVRVLDEILTDFMQAIAFEATRAAHYSGRQKIKYEDFEFAFRKNPAFLGKVQEVFEKQKEIKKARELLRDGEDEIMKDAADEERRRERVEERPPPARADDDAQAEAYALGKKR